MKEDEIISKSIEVLNNDDYTIEDLEGFVERIDVVLNYGGMIRTPPATYEIYKSFKEDLLFKINKLKNGEI